MAMYDAETARPADDLDKWRHEYAITRERHQHVRATLLRRLRQTSEQMERECSEMGNEIEKINATFPDHDGPAEAPADYPIAVEPRYR